MGLEMLLSPCRSSISSTSDSCQSGQVFTCETLTTQWSKSLLNSWKYFWVKFEALGASRCGATCHTG